MPEDKKTFFGLRKHGNIMWIGMIILSSVWMFVLGIFVGRGTAPVKFDIEKLQKELIALKETVLNEQKERFKAFMETAQKKTDLGFYEALKAHNGTDDLEKGMTKKGPARKAPVPAESVPSVGTAGDEGKTLTIQLSSLRDIEAADALVAKLKQQGYRAYRTTARIAGRGVWYRVRVGYYENKTEAEPIMKQMNRDKYKPYLVKWQ